MLRNYNMEDQKKKKTMKISPCLSHNHQSGGPTQISLGISFMADIEK